jgi:hypothetical protein
MNKDKLKNYFIHAKYFDKLIWAVAGILLIKWLLGPVSSYNGFFRLTGGTALWAVVLYASLFVAIRLGLLASYVKEKIALLSLFGVYAFFILLTAFMLELRNAQVQFLLSLAVIGLQAYAYRQNTAEPKE